MVPQATDRTHATYINIYYDLTDRIKPSHEISYNLMQEMLLCVENIAELEVKFNNTIIYYKII